MHVLEAGPDDGVPILLVHGNMASGRFFEHLMPGAPAHLRLIAPDMRGFGATDPSPIDATRGLRDWADDIHALLVALGIDAPIHLAGWSAGGAAAASYVLAGRSVASLTLIAPVPPYGFGGVRPDGAPHFEDCAGSGAGHVEPEFVDRLAACDRSTESPLSPRVQLRIGWRHDYQLAPEREELLLDEMLAAHLGPDGFPGDVLRSQNWPGYAPGTRGIVNAFSCRYCDWSALPEIEPKPPILWVHGSADVICADDSPSEAGMRGQLGEIPGWPGPDAYPPQPMVTQTRAVLERYAALGGRVQMEWFEGSGHAPQIDAAERFAAVLFDFVTSRAVPATPSPATPQRSRATT